ncbi:MAG: phosphatase PAP2 family protein [Niabella sp.]
MKRRSFFWVAMIFFLVGLHRLNAQDSVSVVTAHDTTFVAKDISYKLNYKKLIIPTIFIAYGVAGLEIDALKQLDRSTRHEIWEHRPKRIRLDDYTQYAPAVLVYGLNAAGIKGKHNFKDRTIIYATSQVISFALVNPLKRIVKEERPDGSDKHSFPSGHTATAFSAAHFMFREYKDTHFWLSISGYSLAAFTGVYRTLNDKHWVSDVVAGAGFGILSTELAYWMYPKVKTLFGDKNKTSTTMIMPFYQNKSFGMGLVKSF